MINGTVLKKYLTLLSLSWEEGLVYRMSVFMWRIRRFLAALMSLTIWTTIYTSSAGSHFGYAQSEMISYIFLISVLQNLVLATVLQGLAQDVNTGAISNILLKPISLYGYLATQEIADKLKNSLAMIFEFIALFMLFRPELVIPSLSVVAVFIAWVVGAIVLNFFISLLFGSLGFWSPETWAPRFLFYIFIQFTAGQLFPLDVLPAIVQKIVYVTPFPYLSFVQTQLFLEKLTTAEIGTHTIVLIMWILGTGTAAFWIWKKGLKDYDAAGR